MAHALPFTALLGSVSFASAHLFLQQPVPMNGNAVKDPLDASGANFPCHGVAIGSGGTVNTMTAGSTQSLIFDGGSGGVNTAVHGGGSCQVSITYETDAAAVQDPNNWKVLYSVEGGCPTNSPLNLDGQYQSASGSYTGAYQCSDPKTNGYDCLNSFDFSIPKAVKSGNATMAWTWFNNVGNREIYMNCINVNIEGGASDDSGLADLPAMFVANLANVNPTCKTTEDQNVGFPDPGPNLATKRATSNFPVPTAKDYPTMTPSGCGSANAAKPTAAPAASGSAGNATGPDPAQPAVPSTAPRATAAPAPPAAGALPALAPAPAGKGKGSSNGNGNGNGNGSAAGVGANVCPTGSVDCSSAGYGSVVCMDATHFGMCDYNKCAVTQAVAAGTQCQAGAISAMVAPADTSNKTRRIKPAVRGLAWRS